MSNEKPNMEVGDKLYLIDDESGVCLWHRGAGRTAMTATSIGGRHEFDTVDQAVQYLIDNDCRVREVGNNTWEITMMERQAA